MVEKEQQKKITKTSIHYQNKTQHVNNKCMVDWFVRPRITFC